MDLQRKMHPDQAENLEEVTKEGSEERRKRTKRGAFQDSSGKTGVLVGKTE